MRNEGPFLLEWVCWYRMLGFTDILIVTNDCTDHSPELLDALQRAGWVTHLRCDVPPGEKIVARKLKLARSQPQVRRADWVLVCDVDEFLVIHRGAGLIGDLVPPADQAPFLGMAINWRVFGTSGHKTWSDGLVHRDFRRAGPLSHPISRWVKTIHRHADWFQSLGEHGPRDLYLPDTGLDWGAPGMAWVNAEGANIAEWQPEGRYLRTLPLALVTYKIAQMNHYMLRSDESFGLKRGTLSSVALADRYNGKYYRSANRNEERDSSALRYSDVFDQVHAQSMALPDVWRLHHLCCIDYLHRLSQKSGRSLKDDPRFAHHLAALK